MKENQTETGENIESKKKKLKKIKDYVGYAMSHSNICLSFG